MRIRILALTVIMAFAFAGSAFAQSTTFVHPYGMVGPDGTQHYSYMTTGPNGMTQGFGTVRPNQFNNGSSYNWNSYGPNGSYKSGYGTVAPTAPVYTPYTPPTYNFYTPGGDE